MGIATEEQSKRMADAIDRDSDRPLVERLRDPKNHHPAALRLEAANRIAELETRDAVLREAVAWFDANRPSWGPGTLPTWYVDATRKS